MEALKFIFILIAIYYVLKLSVRYFFPLLMKRLADNLLRKAQQGGGTTFTYQTFGQQNYQGQYQQRSQRTDEKKVSVDYIPNKEEQRKGTETAGEFIDFEEIKN